MTIQRTADDWTSEDVRRLWDWISSREDMHGLFFSESQGVALQNLLLQAGQLRGRVLDFGCGPGFLLKRLCQFEGVEAEGVDFSPSNVAETRARLEGAPRFLGATVVDGLPSPLPERRFDLVTCIEVIEHLTDAQFQDTLTEILRLLRPGGRALFTTPNEEELSKEQSYCPFCDSQFHRWQHLRSFSATQLREALIKRGFDIVFCEGIDLSQFQPPRRRRVLDTGVREAARKLVRKARDTTALVSDKLSGADFPRTASFRARLRSGPHLVAFAQRPAQGP